MTETTGKIIVTLSSRELEFEYDKLGVTFDSTADEIIEAVTDAVLEEENINIKEDNENLYTVKKVDESKNAYIFPKSVAGM